MIKITSTIMDINTSMNTDTTISMNMDINTSMNTDTTISMNTERTINMNTRKNQKDILMVMDTAMEVIAMKT